MSTRTVKLEVIEIISHADDSRVSKAIIRVSLVVCV